jgi:ribonuclease BN (tRNA processing enzyme)
MRSHRVSVVVGFLGLALAVPAWFREAPAEYKPSPQTQIVLLGTGTPGPSPDRFGPCTAIVVNGSPYLVDLGPGVVRRAAAAYQKGVLGLRVTNLKIAFITHLHSDHTVGYPDFIFTPWVVGRSGPVEVFGPPGTRAMTDHVLAAWKEDIEVRTQGLERDFPEHNDTGYKVNAHEIQPGVIYKDGNVTVTAFPVAHGEWPHAFGYRFETVDRTIVISGDTSPTDNVVRACNGCDVLIHEVYTQKAHATSPASWQKYRPKYHTSSKELAEIATRARPKLLILYHQGYGVGGLSSEEDLIKEMRAAYKGDFVSGHDLDMF